MGSGCLQGDLINTAIVNSHFRDAPNASNIETRPCLISYNPDRKKLA